MDTSEIPDGEINVEKIMRKIKKSIKKRRESEVHQGVMEATITEPDRTQEIPNIVDEIQKDLEYINSNWDIQNNSYLISSHRSIVGKAFVTCRELVHGEVRRYVDPMIWNQKEFNESVVRILNESTKVINETFSSIKELKKSADQVQGSFSTQIDNNVSQVHSKLPIEIYEKLAQARTGLSMEVDNKLAQNQVKHSTEIDEKLAQARTGLSMEVDNKLAQNQVKLSTEIDEKLAQARTGLSMEVDNKLAQNQVKLSTEIYEKLAQACTGLSMEVDNKLAQNQVKLSTEIEEQVRAVIAAMNEDIENRVWLAGILDKRIAKNIDVSSQPSESQGDGMNYFVFEERFRGSRADIKGRQSAFIKYFEGCRNVLDIGCGRGEFLELLRDNGIKGRGIDVDEDMITFCKSKGLDVERIDALSYLYKLEDKKLDGIFIDQVVEHLEPDYLIRMLGLCYKKLIYGGAIVVETVNPLSFSSFANFYLDMSHKRPVHPETLRFLLGAEGFREIEALFFAAVPEEQRLIEVDSEPDADEKELRAFKAYNHNIDILNNILFGPQDYAIVGRK